MMRPTRRIARVFTVVTVPVLSIAVASIAVASSVPATRRAESVMGSGGGLPPYDTWIRDVTTVADEASAYLKERMTKRPAAAAIVLDIDNTALESTYHGGSGSKTPATAPVLALALQARAAGVAVFFVTARDLNSGIPAYVNLQNVGYPVDDIYFYHMDEGISVAKRKTNSRIDIEKKGYIIVANIGNNLTDLDGGHAERTFKLPDYNGQLP